MLIRSHFNRFFIALPLIEPDIGVRDKYESLTPDLISRTRRMHFLLGSSEVESRSTAHVIKRVSCAPARHLLQLTTATGLQTGSPEANVDVPSALLYWTRVFK